MSRISISIAMHIFTDTLGLGDKRFLPISTTFDSLYSVYIQHNRRDFKYKFCTVS
jgi:hypothetical protein